MLPRIDWLGSIIASAMAAKVPLHFLGWTPRLAANWVWTSLQAEKSGDMSRYERRARAECALLVHNCGGLPRMRPPSHACVDGH